MLRNEYQTLSYLSGSLHGIKKGSATEFTGYQKGGLGQTEAR